VPHTLLLADDSVTIQRVIELTFADEDVNVVAVSDGDQAIQSIEAAPPDIVLADIGMPGKNGYEVAQHIRQTPRLAHIPVVLLTGAFEPVDQARAAEAGCDGVLAKPFEPQLVIGRVKELLAKAHGKPEASAPAPAAPAPAAPRAEAARGGWPPPPPEPPKAAAEPSQAAPPAFDLHDYFDRLDAAFSTGASEVQPPAPAPAPAPSNLDWFSAQASSAPAGESWEFEAPQEPQATYASPPPAQAFPAFQPPEAVPPAPAAEAPVPLSFAGDVPPIAPPEPSDVPPPAHAVADAEATLASMPPSPAGLPVAAQAAPSQATPASQPSHAASALPPLADAFAALLVAEQDEPASEAATLWRAGAAPAAPIDDAVIEEVVRRVLERLSDEVVRETVGDIVSRVAEQLVRQEIERIKAQLR